MTNYQKWFAYTDGLPTPDRMVSWSFYSMIASCLQRRVWLDSNDDPLYPPEYVILVSPPGVGKSLIINKVDEMIRFWKHGDNAELMAAKFKDDNNKTVVEAVIETDRKHASGQSVKSQQEDSEVVKPYLIPIAADATTYEALVLAFGKCYRRVMYKEYNEKAEKEIILPYGHSSLCFLLKELGSLLRKRTNDTVTLLLGLYDCPVDYEYDTVTREKDRIRRGCLNILGATNPSFMNQIFDEKLIDPAFLSRCIFVYCSKNRKPVSKIPPLTPEQNQYKIDIRNHLLKLSTLYGLVKVEPGVDEWIHEWYLKHELHPELRSSKNAKLAHYYSRKLVHMKKLACAIHFGESTDMTIGIEAFKQSVEFLDKEEKFMHLALTLDAKDIGSKFTKSIQEMLTPVNGELREMNMVDIMMELYATHGLQDKKETENAIDFLHSTNQVRFETKNDETTGNTVNYWRLV